MQDGAEDEARPVCRARAPSQPVRGGCLHSPCIVSENWLPLTVGGGGQMGAALAAAKELAFTFLFAGSQV